MSSSAVYLRNKSSKTTKSDSDLMKGAEKARNAKKGPSDKEVLLGRGFYMGRKLGSGSYSTVRFAATRDHFNKVAIKIIDRRKAPQDYQNKFLPRELHMIKTLINPSVIRTYDWFEAENKVYQILELAEGGDVLEYIRTTSKGAVGMELLHPWLHQITRAVSFLHIRGVFHRDIKCENLLLDAKLNVKLSDFGFAKYAINPLCETYCGSVAYAAPEIINSEPYNGYAADVWAVGVVAYILATGYMPFGDDVTNVSRIYDAQLRGVEFPPTDTHIDEELKDLIRKMLTVDPRERTDIHCVLGSRWCRSVEPLTEWPSMRDLTL